VAVLGCGIDQAYPPENRDLFERIAAGGGAVVSEFTPGTRPVRGNFPRRNRTIAGLSHATVVVRAAPGSGALGTAKHAAARGRPLFAVRGDARDPLCAGPNSLLESGRASPVGSAADILANLGWEGIRPNPNRDAAHHWEAEIPAGLDATARTVWGVLDGRTSIHVDDVAARAHVPAREALRRLTELELLGLCVQKPGKHFQRC
jgi:DNA processing protein